MNHTTRLQPEEGKKRFIFVTDSDYCMIMHLVYWNNYSACFLIVFRPPSHIKGNYATLLLRASCRNTSAYTGDDASPEAITCARSLNSATSTTLSARQQSGRDTFTFIFVQVNVKMKTVLTLNVIVDKHGALHSHLPMNK